MARYVQTYMVIQQPKQKADSVNYRAVVHFTDAASGAGAIRAFFTHCPQAVKAQDTERPHYKQPTAQVIKHGLTVLI